MLDLGETIREQRMENVTQGLPANSTRLLQQGITTVSITPNVQAKSGYIWGSPLRNWLFVARSMKRTRCLAGLPRHPSRYSIWGQMSESTTEELAAFCLYLVCQGMITKLEVSNGEFRSPLYPTKKPSMTGCECVHCTAAPRHHKSMRSRTVTTEISLVACIKWVKLRWTSDAHDFSMIGSTTGLRSVFVSVFVSVLVSMFISVLVLALGTNSIASSKPTKNCIISHRVTVITTRDSPSYLTKAHRGPFTVAKSRARSSKSLLYSSPLDPRSTMLACRTSCLTKVLMAVR